MLPPTSVVATPLRRGGRAVLVRLRGGNAAAFYHDRPHEQPRAYHIVHARKMTYCLDVETFISEVKKHPVIWDVNSEDNRYKTKKQSAWAEIASVFVPEFDDMPDIEKIDVYRKLYGKWRNIRDSFVRHIRETHKRKDGKRGYMYATQLSFLNNLYKLNGEASDEEAENNESCPSDIDEPQKFKKLGYKRKAYDLLGETSIWPSDGEDSIEDLKRKRTNPKRNDIEYVDTPFPENSCSYQMEDEDRSFFESLLPAVRGFNLDQKLEFRSEVIGLIKSIRSNVQKFKLDPETGDFN